MMASHGLETQALENGRQIMREAPEPQRLEDGAMQYLKFVSKRSELLSGEEEIELGRRISLGDEGARQKLAQANLRLVIHIAKRYAGKGAVFMDLVQEGNVGLMRAVDKFDYRKGYRFSTYATWWIKQSVFQAFAEHDRPIRLPLHVIDAMTRLRKVRDELKDSLDRAPTDGELAEALGLPIKKVQQLVRVSRRMVSLEAETMQKDGNSQSLAELIEDERFDPETELYKNRALALLKLALLRHLDDRERDVLFRRFGLHAAAGENARKMTLEQIGGLYGVTRETIRQTELRAISKLRQSEYLQQLVD